MAEIIILPSFQEKLSRIKDKSHINLISKLIKKLAAMGKNALKILTVIDNYLLCEMKVMRPPYRLYVIVDQSSEKYYVADWEHKQKQEKAIGELREKLAQAVKIGLDKIFT